MTSLNVTLHSLSVGAQSGTAPYHYQKSYVDSVIKMFIAAAGAGTTMTDAGEAVQVNAVGYTDVAVHEGDTVTDAFARTYTVLSVQPWKLGNLMIYYEVALSGYAPEGSSPYVAPCIVFILATDGGTTNPAEGMYVYNVGDAFSVVATASTGCIFKEWQRDDGTESTSATLAFTISRTCAIMATFSDETIPPYPSGIGLYIGSDSFGNPTIEADLAFPTPTNYDREIESTLAFPTPLNNDAEIESTLAFPAPLNFSASITVALNITVT